ncbi:hypothetical protein D3C78_1479330 [compost metagenome]
MASGRTAFASGGKISGSGLASAMINGSLAMVFTISWVNTPGPEQPRNISASGIASPSVRWPLSSMA